MSGQTLKLLLDTNVWLDLFIPSNPEHGAAWDFMQATAAYDDPAGREVVLLYPARIMGDVFYKVRLEANAGWALLVKAPQRNVLVPAATTHGIACRTCMNWRLRWTLTSLTCGLRLSIGVSTRTWRTISCSLQRTEHRLITS